MNKRIIFLGIMLLATTIAIQTKFVIHNETGKNGTPVNISYTLDPKGDEDWNYLAPGASVEVHPQEKYSSGIYYTVCWDINGKEYHAKIKKPKDLYIYSNGEYLTWVWKNLFEPNAERVYDPFDIAVENKNLKAN